MKAIRVAQYGPVEGLSFEELASPVPGQGEVLIEVAGSGVNPVDWKVLSGAMKAFIPLQLPYTPGVEVAGRVAAVGENVSGLAVGDEVFGFINIVGGYATEVVASAERLAHRPNRLTALQASGVPAVALTAWQALHEHARIKAGQRVLIHGAAGGVGSMAVQMARMAGATVIATASAYNHDYLQALGAAQVIDYNQAPFESVVDRVDVVLDLVGGDTQVRSWSVLKPGGVLVSPVSPPDASLAEAAGACGKHFATRSDGAQLQHIASLFESGELVIEVQVLPLSQAEDALRQSKERHIRGKLVLDASR
ncbi:NADP-dependent oxidoreductase [Pseudomonas sp. 21TX0197]|jgi:NADPH:quinone reductase-like Zn-dependent oxidoreductase|uniref:NADP-dependent oxidoreductase n=1 Tax=Pseudomonas TaxID=286 RepID=UPI00069D80AF|nr:MULTISPECIES: NADP-dependent oxidoreductase [Pseudomonas]MDB6443748.1 NADP-dependent oxidoreductase [Pseudomonas sp. 21TX0197]MDT8904863.1 NADP-dependent oxidoreductase [Pseudomonas prosekii]NHN68707.1 NADP-dependent oxidoreductase [Pseudomonas fluorescens]ROO38002.1 oxidoreductase [Pseudomonas sp. AF76]SFW66790.1 NADPH:quinone reductase [Pseudomonas sp. NFACC09-4]